MRFLIPTLSIFALLLPLASAQAAPIPASGDELLIELEAVDRGFTPVEADLDELLRRDFEFLATNECSTANDCPCPGLCYCVSPGTSTDTYCLCRTSCCTGSGCP